MEQNHIMNLVVLEDVGAGTPTTAQGQYCDGLTDLVDGEWVVANDQNLILSAASVLTDPRVAVSGFKLLGRNDNNLISSDLIRLNDIISITATDVAAAAEQVTHLGYNATSGAIQIINDNTYKIKIMFWEEGRTGQGQNDFLTAYYTSDASATGGEVVFALEELLRLASNKQAERPIRFGILNSAALDANLTISDNVTVVNGSKFIVTAAAWTCTDAVSTPAVGDFLRVGSATETDAAVALGSMVYKVIAINGTVIELDRPVTGVSGLYTTDADVSLIPVATAEAASWGMRMTGIARTHVVGKRPYSKVRFTVGLEDFGTTAVVYTTNMTLGHGTFHAIRDLEYFCHGNTGDKYRGDYMYLGYTTNVAASTSGFVQISLVWAPGARTEGIGGPGHNPKQLIIAADDAFANTEGPDLVIEIMDAVMTALYGAGNTTGLAK